jgi:hypothetical protein
MKLPPEIQFYEDAHLLVYRPRGLLNEASVNKVINVIEDLEASKQKPFNRFLDTLEHDEVELNFRYVINVPSVGASATPAIRRLSQQFSRPIPRRYITPSCMLF